MQSVIFHWLSVNRLISSIKIIGCLEKSGSPISIQLSFACFGKIYENKFNPNQTEWIRARVNLYWICDSVSSNKSKVGIFRIKNCTKQDIKHFLNWFGMVWKHISEWHDEFRNFRKTLWRMLKKWGYPLNLNQWKFYWIEISDLIISWDQSYVTIFQWLISRISEILTDINPVTSPLELKG